MYRNNHTTLKAHTRAEKRQGYARIYVCVAVDPVDALRDSKDGALLAWTNWDQAMKFAGRCGMIVVNWEGFLARYLDRLTERPPAARIFVFTHRGVQKYHADLDASADEMRTLNTYCDWELQRRPEKLGRKLRQAKVWPEAEQ